MSSVEGSTPSGYFSAKSASYAGNAANDLLGGIASFMGDNMKAKGLEVEGQDYTLAAQYAGEEADYSRASTAFQDYMAHRSTELAVGNTTSEVANAGFTSGGSAGDILAESARQGAQQYQLTDYQGQITTQGYVEQEQSYQNLAKYSAEAAKSETTIAGISLASGIVGAVGNIAAMAGT